MKITLNVMIRADLLFKPSPSYPLLPVIWWHTELRLMVCLSMQLVQVSITEMSYWEKFKKPPHPPHHLLNSQSSLPKRKSWPFLVSLWVVPSDCSCPVRFPLEIAANYKFTVCQGASNSSMAQINSISHHQQETVVLWSSSCQGTSRPVMTKGRWAGHEHNFHCPEQLQVSP